MADNIKNLANAYTREELLGLGIYDLRTLGRDIGVSSPTTMKKEQLVDAILAIIYGEAPKRVIGKGRGRPARAQSKPCNLLIDLVERIEPKCQKTFIYDGMNPYDNVFTHSDLLSSKVATTKSGYSNDQFNPDDKVLLRRSVVCLEGNRAFARKLKFVQSDTDCEIPLFMVEDYKLQDCDLIEYLPDDVKPVVAQIFRINGQFASRTRVVDIPKEPSSKIFVTDSLFVETQKSNVLYSPKSEDRQKLIDSIASTFDKEGYSVIKVCFDRLVPDRVVDSQLKVNEFFACSIGDEYETIAMVEAGIERVRYFNMTGARVVLLIDDLSWLISVVESYPKTVYGNFIMRLAKLSKEPNSNITVICLSGHLSNERVKVLSGMFDNIQVD